MGPGTDTPVPARTFRRNDLDEMTVGRTEKPVTGALPDKPDAAKSTKRFSPLLEGQPEIGEARDDPRPLVRGKAGVGSYEDAGDVKRQKRTKGKTGRPGR
jgi:excinuclease ABC subunit B